MHSITTRLGSCALASLVALLLAALAGTASAQTAISARFADGVLTVRGDARDNNIVVSRDAAGKILVNNGAVPVQDGSPTVANTSLIRVFGERGNDTIALDEANGPLPAAKLDGGAGDDTMTGGSRDDVLKGGAGIDFLDSLGGNDLLLGQGGDDTLFSRAGVDRVRGGAGDDFLDAGPGDDLMFGDGGQDAIVWDIIDDSDRIEGGPGLDEFEFEASDAAETFGLSAKRSHFLLNFSVNAGQPQGIVLDVTGVEEVEVGALDGADKATVNDLTRTDVLELNIDAGAGDDSVHASGLGAGAARLTVNGGPGNDALTGGQGNDRLDGATGDDKLDGGPGRDILDGGPGTDTAINGEILSNIP